MRYFRLKVYWGSIRIIRGYKVWFSGLEAYRDRRVIRVISVIRVGTDVITVSYNNVDSHGAVFFEYQRFHIYWGCLAYYGC